MGDTDSPAGLLFVLSNVGIFLGYIFLGAFVVPRAAARLRRTKVGGAVFFITCGLTHLEQVFHYRYAPDESFLEYATTWHMLAIHIIQVAAVWAFVTGLYLEMVRWGPWSAGADTGGSEYGRRSSDGRVS